MDDNTMALARKHLSEQGHGETTSPQSRHRPRESAALSASARPSLTTPDAAKKERRFGQCGRTAMKYYPPEFDDEDWIPPLDDEDEQQEPDEQSEPPDRGAPPIGDDSGPPIHPAANTFPPMREDSQEFKDLVDSFKKHGWLLELEPILMMPDGETILLGRNRRNACLKACVEPQIKVLPEGWNGDPLTLVIESNRQRKQWTPAQLAKIAFGLTEPQIPARARERG
jgi:hypothetical protein